MQLSGLEPEWLELDGASFKLQPLTSPQRMECLSFGGLNTAHLMFQKACEYAVVDWKDIDDENGPVAFDRDLLPRLPQKTWAAIARHVLGINSFEAEDEKN